MENPDRPEGEDHREGPPGYDFDEQQAIHELERRRREQAAAEREEEDES